MVWDRAATAASTAARLAALSVRIVCASCSRIAAFPAARRALNRTCLTAAFSRDCAAVCSAVVFRALARFTSATFSITSPALPSPVSRIFSFFISGILHVAANAAASFASRWAGVSVFLFGRLTYGMTYTYYAIIQCHLQCAVVQCVVSCTYSRLNTHTCHY